MCIPLPHQDSFSLPACSGHNCKVYQKGVKIAVASVMRHALVAIFFNMHAHWHIAHLPHSHTTSENNENAWWPDFHSTTLGHLRSACSSHSDEACCQVDRTDRNWV